MFGIRLLFTVPVLFFLISCGGSGGDRGSTNETSGITRVVIEPGSILLPGIDESQTLIARAYNGQGEEIDADFAWDTNDLGSVAFTQQDNQLALVTSKVSVGSAQIVAQANGVISDPVIVLIAAPAQNTIIIDDSDVLSFPQPINLNSNSGLGFRYKTKILKQEIEIGDKLLARGDAPISGRVVEIQFIGNEMEITLETVTISEMFSELVVNETIPLRVNPSQISDTVAQFYDVEISSDGDVLFSLKENSPLARPEFGYKPESIGPFKCDIENTVGSTDPSILSFEALPVSFSLSEDLDFNFKYDSNNNGLQELSLSGDIKASFKLNPNIKTGLEGKIDCSKTLLTIPVPVNGVLSYIAGVSVPIKIGFEIGGKLTLAEIGIELTTEASANAKLGYICPVGSSCSGVSELTTDSKADYKLNFPSINLDEQFRLEPSLSSYVGANLQIGSRFFEALQLEALKLRAGLILDANLASVNAQAQDETYKSDYKLSANLSAGFGSEGQEAIERLKGYGVIGSFTKADFKNDFVLFPSPKPVSDGLTADKDVFKNGDTVRFSINLDPNSVDFYTPPVVTQGAFLPDWTVYNVDQVIIYRKDKLGVLDILTEVARTTADSGQTAFNIDWSADYDGNISNDFFAFVSTTVLPIPQLTGRELGELELGKVSALRGDGKIAFIDGRVGNRIFLINSDGSNLTNIYNRDAEELSYISSYVWSPDGKKLSVSFANQSLYVVNADGSGLVKLTDSASPSISKQNWSPDSTRFAFTSDADGDYEIYTINVDGTGLTQLTDNESLELSPRWSPSGEKIFFIRSAGKRDIFSISPEGRAVTNYTNYLVDTDHPNYLKNVAPHPVNISPDGNSILFSLNSGSFDSTLQLLNINSGEITEFSGLNNVRFYKWSPDGNQIGFGDQNDGQIKIMDSDGTNLRNIMDQPFVSVDYTGWSWSPDGSEIAFFGEVDNGLSDFYDRADIYKVRIDGTSLIKLTNMSDPNNPAGRAWAPRWQP